MTNTEMDAIQIQDAPVFLQRTLSPRIKLLSERLVQAADRAGTGCHSQQRLGHFSHLVSTRPSSKHLGQSFGNVRFRATVAFKGLCVEVPFAVSGDFDLLK